MHLSSPAKINLSLAVGPRDERGYHPVDTVVHLLSFGDTLTFRDADELTVSCSRDLGIAECDNLAYRAAELMGEVFGRPIPLAIHIDKHIPHGAGLGGGSSNAGAVIREIARRWQIPPEDERLTHVARALGSDVGAFLAPTACSHLTGYGDVLASSLTARSGLPLVVAMVDGAHASTAEVYRVFDEIGAPDPVLPFRNDLSEASMRTCDATRQALEWLRAQPHTDTAQVCGSGAACFAMVASDTDACELADSAQARGFWAVATNLL